MDIISPLTQAVCTKQVPNTPYWIDPVCGLLFQNEPYNTFPSQVKTTYPEAEGAACKALAQALVKNWLGGTAVGCRILDLGAREAAMKDQWIDLGAHHTAASPGLFPSQLPEGDDRYNLITMVHSFQRIAAANVPLALLSLHHALKEEGTLFLRMPSSDVKGHERDFTPLHFQSARCMWSLDSFLEALYQTTSFKIVETYEVGSGTRDYLLKRITKKPTVCIGMIAKNEERDLPKCLESLSGMVDGLCLMDTGSTDRTMQVAHEWAAKEGLHKANCDTRTCLHIGQYFGASEKDESGDWKLWDFGKARNQYVEWIENAGFDWVLWMDADDKIENARQVRNACLLDQYTVHAFGIESGGLEWHHHRMWKTSAKIRYHGRCHEYPHFGAAPTFIHPGINIRHQTEPVVGMENSNPRNLRILQREFAETPTARCAFYLANTFKDAGRPAEAIPIYQARLNYGKAFWDEWMFALLYKGRCERLAGKLDDARRTLLEGVREHSGWAEFWMELHHVEIAAGQPWKALGYAAQALDAPIVPTSLFREQNQYTDQPYRSISWAFEKLQFRDMALKFAVEARAKIGTVDKDWEDRIARLSAPPAKPATIEKSTIVLNRPGAMGDIIMTLNHIQALKKKYPGHRIYYRCHPSIGALLTKLIHQAGCDWVLDPDFKVQNAQEFNLVGYPLREGYPEKPMRKHLLEYFADELGIETDWDSLVIDTPEKPYGLPERYVTVHPQAGWSMYKNWPADRWEKVIEHLKLLDIQVVQIGGPGDKPLKGAIFQAGPDWWKSLSILAHGTTHMGVDSWSNHALNIVWKGYVNRKNSGVILWGSTQASAAGYKHNTNLSAGLPCQPCFRENPKISAMSRGVCPHPADQTYEDPKHECMQAIPVEDVIRAVLGKWAENS